MKVSDLMTADPIALLADETVLTAARAMREHDIGLIPIVHDLFTMRLIGVLTEGDIATRCVAARHWGGCSVREHMTRAPLHSVRPWESAETAMRVMRSGGVRRMPVIDADGRLVGVLSQTDMDVASRSAMPSALLNVGT